MNTTSNYINSAKRTLTIEARAVQALVDSLGAAFDGCCDLILACNGRVVVTGMGKSGHIGKKIAATLASTGTPAFFMHPGEASHGDLGMITANDVVIALSNSGATQEVLYLVPLIKRLQAPMIAMTGKPDSELATAASFHLNVAVAEEACPLGLAPTSSTTATLAMGDALAVALLEARGFTAEDFAFSHPGGALGRKLLLKVADLKVSGPATPAVSPQCSVRDALFEVTSKGLGMTTVINAEQQLLGVFTDGDLRRAIDRNTDIINTPVQNVMTAPGLTCQDQMLAAEALGLMEARNITALPVVDADNKVSGVIHLHELIKAGLA